MKLKSNIYSEQEAFQRLHETYLILQHHNEEGLALRLMTEKRLKDLFSQERQQKEISKKIEADRKEYSEKNRDQEKVIKELEAQCQSYEELVREKDGIAKVIREELTA